MKLSNAFYTLALAATVTSVISEDTEPTFVVGDTCIFPVSLYLSNTCAEFWSTGVTSIIADGECHFIPGSKFTDKVDPGPYYRAVCDETGGNVKFLAAECNDAACTQCEQYSGYTDGANQGIFDMTLTECQSVITSSFISTGPLQSKVETDVPGVISSVVPAVPAATTAPVATPTAMPVVPMTTTAPAASATTVTVIPIATTAPVAPPTTVPAGTPAPVTVATQVPAVPQVPCRWDLRYYDRTDSLSTFTTCSVVNLLAPNQRAFIIADGECNDSGIASVGFYQAMCDSTGGIVFLKNKCADATCAVCDMDSDVYTGTAYKSGVCSDHDSSPLKAWLLWGTCELPSCELMTSSSSQPVRSSSFALTALP